MTISYHEYEPGSMPPQGYLQWHQWAEAQEKAGLRQSQCGCCGLWRYPQELSKTTKASTMQDQHQRPILLNLPVCLDCESKLI